MTTQKTLRKVIDTVFNNADKNIEDADELMLLNVFAQTMFPKTYKLDKRRAINKTNFNITVCVERNYLNIDHSATTLDNFISLTEQGAKRIEETTDNLQNFIIKILCALGGAMGTVAASFLIQLIQSHI